MKWRDITAQRDIQRQRQIADQDRQRQLAEQKKRRQKYGGSERHKTENEWKVSRKGQSALIKRNDAGTVEDMKDKGMSSKSAHDQTKDRQGKATSTDAHYQTKDSQGKATSRVAILSHDQTKERQDKLSPNDDIVRKDQNIDIQGITTDTNERSKRKREKSNHLSPEPKRMHCTGKEEK
jgi:hypothetical protein